MATYSTAPRIRALYKTCEGRYVGFGPVGAKPKRLKVTAFFSTRRRRWRMNMMLSA